MKIEYIFVAIFGGALTAIGHHVWDWQFWLLLLLFVGYGVSIRATR